MPAIIISKDAAFAQRVIDMIKTCYDPEIPVDIWELGLIYEINVSDEKNVNISMTLTSPNCPAAETLPSDVETRVKEIEGVGVVKVEVVFEPPWEKEMMSEVAQLELGFM
jgi:FeS assembly SUF system protein